MQGGGTGLVILGLLTLLVGACGPAAPAREEGDRPPVQRIQRTLVFVHGGETQSFAHKEILPTASATATRSAEAKLLLNARLALLDERGLPQPFLAEGLPELNTSTWRVSPDGKMEITYRLRPNLTWHDGQPLTGDDFVFAQRIYANPDFGISQSGSSRYLEDVTAPDGRTVVLHWKQPNPDAVTDVNVVPPLPKHTLEPQYQRASSEAFMALPFWREEYVGLGPWKLDRREPGAFFEASAFDGFVFGRPKIDKVRVVYIPDTNVAVSTMLAGDVHYAMESLMYGEEGLALERGWAGGGGTVGWEAISGRAMEFQMRPEFAVPAELATDARVRAAIANLIDREALVEVITSGKGLLRDAFTHQHVDYYDAVSRAVSVRYRYDARRAQQLLEQAGYSRGPDGLWVSGRGQRFTLEQWYIAGASNERESTILVDGLRQNGIDAMSHVFGVQRTSNEDRAKTPGMFGGSKYDPRYHSAEIARPETRWTGGNRFGYTNATLDRLIDKWDTTLDRSERIQALVEMEKIAMEDLPALPMYWNVRVMASVAGLKGTVTNLTPDAGGERKVWEWYWES